MIDNRGNMRRLRYWGLAVILIALTCASCSKDNDLEQGSTHAAVLPIKDTDVNPLGDDWTVAYTSGESWKLQTSSSVTWVTFDTYAGKAGTTEIRISVQPNTEEYDRKVEVSFIEGSSEKASFTISQEAARLKPDISVIESGWLGSDHVLNVESNIRWRLSVSHVDEEDKSWLSVQEGSYEKDMSLNVNFNGNNFSGEDHAATIRLVPYKLNNNGGEISLNNTVLKNLTREIPVSQANLIFLVNDKAEDPELSGFSEFGSKVDSLGQPYVTDPVSQSMTIRSETEWSIDKVNADWLEVSEPMLIEEDYANGIKTHSLTLNVADPNPYLTDQTGVIRLVSREDENAFREIHVTQNGYLFEAVMMNGDVPDPVMPEDTSGVAELLVRTNGPWRIDPSSIPEWATVDDSFLSGVGETRIPVTSPVWNMKLTRLQGNIVFNTDGINDLQSLPEIYKEAFQFNIGENVVSDRFSVREILETLPMKNTMQYDFEVNSSGPWDMTMEYEGSAGEWFSVSQDEGTGHDMLTVGALSENPDKDSDRTVLLTFVSRMHQEIGEDVRVEIPVTQQKYTFEIGDYLFENVPAYMKNGIQYSTKLSCSYDWTLWTGGGVNVTSDSNGSNALTSGDGLTYPMLYLNVGTNIQKEPVTKYVYVRSDYDSETKSIEIRQDAFVFDIQNDFPTGSLPYNAENTYVAQVESTEDVVWEIQGVSQSSWVKPGVQKGTGSGEVTFTTTKNGTLSSRTANVTFYNTVSLETQTFTFNQDAYLFKVSKSSLSSFDEVNARNSAQTFTVQCSDKWSIKEQIPDWLSISPVSGNGGTSTVTVKSLKDNFGAERNFSFTVDGSYAGVSHVHQLSVNQKNYVFEVTGDLGTISLTDNKATTKKVNIKSSGAWTVSTSDSDVVTVSPASGTASRDNAKTCTFSIKTNYTKDRRTATVTVQGEHYSSAYPDFRKTVTISQPAYQFAVDDAEQTIEPAGVEDKAVAVTCSGTWKVESDKEWLTVEAVSGKFTFSVASNKTDGKTDTQQRTATITVSTTDDSKNYFDPVKIIVTQKGEKAK